MRKLILILGLAVTSVVFARTYTRDYNPSSGEGVSFALLRELDVIAGVLRENVTGTDNITDGSIGNADLENNSVTTDKIVSITPAQVKTSSTGGTWERARELIPMLGSYTTPITAAVDEIGYPERGCWVYRVDDDTVGVTPGGAQIKGRYRYNSTATTVDVTSPTTSWWYDVLLVANNSLSTFTVVVQSAGNPGASDGPQSYAKLVGSIYSNSAGQFSSTIQYRDGYLMGWHFLAGNNSTNINTFNLGLTFGSIVWFDVGESAAYHSYVGWGNFLGESATEPTTTNDFSALSFAGNVSAFSRNFFSALEYIQVDLKCEVGETFDASTYYGFNFVYYGRYD